MALFGNNIRRQLSTFDTLQRLLTVNVAVFLIVTITESVLGLFEIHITDEVFSQWLALPAALHSIILKPWTLITYMFSHFTFWHILLNMLWLYWIGRIFQEYLGNKKLFSTYILGGICGAILYIVSYNVFPLLTRVVNSSDVVGASASVLAIIIAAATLVPEYRIGIILIGPVPLKYIALVAIAIDLSSMSGPNAGGHIAHLGGAIFGFVYVRQLKKGTDIANWFNNMMDWIVSAFSGSRRSRMKVRYRRGATDEDYLMDKKAKQERVDEILEKISRSGYGSLSKEEKNFLFKSSKEG